jgi:hypothetical protein
LHRTDLPGSQDLKRTVAPVSARVSSFARGNRRNTCLFCWRGKATHKLPRGNSETPLFPKANKKLLQLAKVARRRHGFEDLMHGRKKLLWVRPFFRVDVVISGCMPFQCFKQLVWKPVCRVGISTATCLNGIRRWAEQTLPLVQCRLEVQPASLRPSRKVCNTQEGRLCSLLAMFSRDVSSWSPPIFPTGVPVSLFIVLICLF